MADEPHYPIDLTVIEYRDSIRSGRDADRASTGRPARKPRNRSDQIYIEAQRCPCFNCSHKNNCSTYCDAYRDYLGKI